MSPTLAGDFSQLSSPSAYHVYPDAYGEEVAARAFIRVDITGTRRTIRDRTSLGLSLNYRNGANDYFVGERGPQPRVVGTEVSISLNDFSDLRLNRQSVNELYVLAADGKSDGNSRVWPWLVGGAAVASAVVAIAITSDDCLDNFFSGECD